MNNKIGQKIKQLREDNNLTVDELSSKIGVKSEYINHIESGDVVPFMATLVKIAGALGTRIGTLLDGEEILGPVISHKRSNLTPDASVSNEISSAEYGFNFYSLSEGKKDRNMEPFIINVNKASGDKFSEHEGEEFVYILEGNVVVRYGSDKYILCQGDSMYYDSIIPHSIGAIDDEGAKVLAVIYSPS